MLTKVSSNKTNGTKNALFCLSRALTHHGFILNLQFLHVLKHKFRLSKNCCGIYHVRVRFDVIKV